MSTLEAQAVARGKERRRKRLQRARERGYTSMEVGSAILQRRVAELADIILSRTYSRTVVDDLAALLRRVGVDEAAFITLRVLLDRVYSKPSRTEAAFAISNAILDEARGRGIKDAAPLLWQHRVQAARRIDPDDSRHRLLLADLPDEPQYRGRAHMLALFEKRYTNPVKLRVGVALLDCARALRGFLKEEPRYSRHKAKGWWRTHTKWVLVPTPELAAELEREPATVPPVRGFLAEPPLPWSKGAYRGELRGSLSLVRQPPFFASKPATPPRLVRDSVDHLASAPLRVNREVYELADYTATRLGGGCAGIPPMRGRPEPVAPWVVERAEHPFEELPPPSPEEVKRHKAKLKAWREDEFERRRRRREFTNTMAVAREALEHDAVWTPWHLDFRGRCYPAASYLHVQGNDLQAALLEWADGVPLGRSGMVSLAIHGANLYGTYRGERLTRQTYQRRYDWVREHDDRIRQAAEDPWADTWWLGSDPLQFWRFAVEWAAFLREGESYSSHIIVSQDQHASGYAHLVGMARDEEGARLLNLTDRHEPDDLYERVVDWVREALERHLHDPDDEGGDLARLWIGSPWIDRKTVKGPTMVYVYGGTHWGFKDGILATLMERDDWPRVREHFTDPVSGRDRTKRAASYLASTIRRVLKRRALRSAVGIMDWLRECARRITRAGRFVTFRVPVTGFEVRPHYLRTERHRVRTLLHGETYMASFHEATKEPDVRKTVAGIVPHVCHALDSALIHLVADEARRRGLTMQAVHDCLLSHAATAEDLAEIMGEQYARLYRQPVLRRLHEAFKRSGVEVPEPPELGSWDPREAREAGYLTA